MFVYEKNLLKLDQIADTTIENIDLFSSEQVEKAIAAVKRLGKALAEAKKAFVKPEEGLDTDPEE